MTAEQTWGRKQNDDLSAFSANGGTVPVSSGASKLSDPIVSTRSMKRHLSLQRDLAKTMRLTLGACQR